MMGFEFDDCHEKFVFHEPLGGGFSSFYLQERCCRKQGEAEKFPNQEITRNWR
jgi:hypothetical protein